MKLAVFCLCCLFFAPSSRAQNQSSPFLLRATLGISGSSESIFLNASSYLVQQSVGQSSTIGTDYSEEVLFFQGFIQPLGKYFFEKIPLDSRLEARVYPNPFIERLILAFTEPIYGNMEVYLYDGLGRQVFYKKYLVFREVEVILQNLPVGTYLLLVSYQNRRMVKKVLKN